MRLIVSNANHLAGTMFSNDSIFVDCDEVCRVCLSGTVELQHIFGQNDNNTIADVLMNLTSISILEEDGMPQKICTLCVHQANSAHYFILKCKQTDRMLRQNLYETKSNEDGLQIGIIDFDANDDSNSKAYEMDTLQPDECVELTELYDIEEQQVKNDVQNEEFICDKCSKSFGCAAELQCHQDDAHPTEVAEIDESTTAADDGEHTNDNDTVEVEAKPYECLKCNKKFQQLHSFNKHKKMHIDSTFICELCGKSFGCQSHLKRHVKETHNPEPKNSNFTCTVCGKEMKRMNHFTVHMRTHRRTTGEPSVESMEDEQNKIKFSCTVCNKMCSSRSNLAVHIRRHSGQMTKFCSVCGKGYPRSTDLTIHMRKHTGERPFKCHLCNRSFARSDKLTIHMRVHTGEKPYSCNNCGRAFAQSNDLASHRKRNVCGAVKPSNNS